MLASCWPTENVIQKRCLELQDITAGHMTFVGAANMLAGPVLMIICILIFPVLC